MGMNDKIIKLLTTYSSVSFLKVAIKFNWFFTRVLA